MRFIKLIRALFNKKKANVPHKQEEKPPWQDPDFIDYDGMGNQGRFPVANKKRK